MGRAGGMYVMTFSKDASHILSTVHSLYRFIVITSMKGTSKEALSQVQTVYRVRCMTKSGRRVAWPSKGVGRVRRGFAFGSVTYQP